MLQNNVTRLEEHFGADGSIQRVFLAAELLDTEDPADRHLWERWLDPADVSAYAALAESERGEFVAMLVARIGSKEYVAWRSVQSRKTPPPRRFSREEIVARVPIQARVAIERPRSKPRLNDGEERP